MGYVVSLRLASIALIFFSSVQAYDNDFFSCTLLNRCEGYVYPNTIEDLLQLCHDKPELIGCSLWKVCTTQQRNSVAIGSISSDLCEPFSILGDICAKDPGMETHAKCKNYRQLCASSGSEYAPCTNQAPMKDVIGTKLTQQQEANMCGQMYMPGCDFCKVATSCTNPLVSISQSCISMPMQRCVDWERMCTSNLGKLGPFCPEVPITKLNQQQLQGQEPQQEPLQPSSSSTPGSSSGSDASSTSSGNGGASGSGSGGSRGSALTAVGSVSEALDKLCGMMPDMIGCSLRVKCKSNDITNSGVCNEYSLLADICAADPGMAGMGGCDYYNSTCTGAGASSECKYPLSKVIGTTKTKQSAVSMCGEMYMKGCDECKALSTCDDPLTSISLMCLSMPMDGCKDWESMCNANKGNLGSVCGDPSGSGVLPPPQMIMYFHTGLSEYILFEQWVPRTTAQYIGTLLFIIALAQVGAGLKLGRKAYEEKLVYHRMTQHNITDTSNSFPWSANLVRGVFSFMVVTIDYLLMLLAMTFNVGIFFAVVFGYALSSFLFGHLNNPPRIGMKVSGLNSNQRTPLAAAEGDVHYYTDHHASHGNTDKNCCDVDI